MGTKEENWQGFSLTSYERSNYMKGLERQLEKDPEDQELISRVNKSSRDGSGIMTKPLRGDAISKSID